MHTLVPKFLGMHFEMGNLYHVYNQGNNKKQVFLSTEDYYYFLRLIRRILFPVTEIIAYNLMPNHFHIMLYADKRCIEKFKQGGIFIDPISNAFRKILSGYTRTLNEKYGSSGSIFRQKTKAKSLSEMSVKTADSRITSDYYANCFYYIHQNPLKAGLVARLEDWHFSSYLDYAGLRNGTLCNKELASSYCAYKAGTFKHLCYDQSTMNFRI
jgi:REP element-mobilizing transposase RayT